MQDNFGTQVLVFSSSMHMIWMLSINMGYMNTPNS